MSNIDIRCAFGKGKTSVAVSTVAVSKSFDGGAERFASPRPLLVHGVPRFEPVERTWPVIIISLFSAKRSYSTLGICRLPRERVASGVVLMPSGMGVHLSAGKRPAPLPDTCGRPEHRSE